MRMPITSNPKFPTAVQAERTTLFINQLKSDHPEEAERLLNVGFACTVRELRELLSYLPDDAEVYGVHEEPICVAYFEAEYGTYATLITTGNG